MELGAKFSNKSIVSQDNPTITTNHKKDKDPNKDDD